MLSLERFHAALLLLVVYEASPACGIAVQNEQVKHAVKHVHSIAKIL
jgi:hypothetical protein